MTREQITDAQRMSREWIEAHPPGGNQPPVPPLWHPATPSYRPVFHSSDQASTLRECSLWGGGIV